MVKRRKKIDGPFVALPHSLIESEAYKSLKPSAKLAYIYFLRDIRSGHQENVTLTFGQAQKYGVCQSPSTFIKAKKQLVANGLLDSVDGGGLNAPAVFKISGRWKWFGRDLFQILPYKSGFSSKYFKTAMEDESKKKKVLDARYPKPRLALSAGHIL